MKALGKLGVLMALAALVGAGGGDGFERERNGRGDDAKNLLEGKSPPSLELGTFHNSGGRRLDWESLKGKVVLLDFWAHWCGPCKAATPKIVNLVRKNSPDLVVIGIHSDPNKDKMLEVAKSLGMNYPVLFDGNKAIMKSYSADSYPDYYLVDRKGVLRFADLANKEVERAVEQLLAEKP